jgi:hypothetical protein
VFYLGLSANGKYFVSGLLQKSIGDSRQSLQELITSSKFESFGDFYVTIHIFVFTALIIKSLLEIRQHVQMTFFYNYNSMNQDKGVTRLRLRTILVQTTQKDHDVTGRELSDFIENRFRANGVRGNV